MIENSAQRCHSCGAIVSLSDEFCRICIAPVNVTKLSEFQSQDHIQLILALVDVLSEATDPIALSARPWLSSYLNCFWMRPESAMYMAAEYEALNKLSNSDDFFVDVDLGCGDGIHSSIINGWDFTDEFDAFGNLDMMGRDIFDSSPMDYETEIIRRKGKKISLGIDIKENSILRAKSLGTFQKLSCSNILSEKFDGAFKCCFSNLVRDFADRELNIVLERISSLLAINAEFYFSAPTQHFKNNLYFFPKIKEQNRLEEKDALRKLNRGRSDFCVQQISAEQWEEKLRPHGFVIENISYFGNRKFTELWDTGMRGFLNIFASYLSGNASIEERKRMKSIFIKYWLPQISAVLNADVSEQTGSFQMIKARLKG